MKKHLFLLLFFCASLFTGAQQTADTIAIKQLLERESATWRSGDVKAHADCWHIRPYSRILVSTPEGICYDVLPENVINPPAGSMGKGGYAILSNYKFSVQKKHAVVSHDEVSVAADGAKTYSYEIRILEKIKGEWKLTGQSIHVYKPR